MSESNAIPTITNSLGAHWDQPSLDEITVDGESALMSEAAWNKLLEYSMSIPSGVYAGKMWKGIYQNGRKCLHWYSDSKKPEHCDINTRDALII